MKRFASSACLAASLSHFGMPAVRACARAPRATAAATLSLTAAAAAACAPSTAANAVAPIPASHQRSFFTIRNSFTPNDAPDAEWRRYHKPLRLQPLLPYEARTAPPHIPRPPYVDPNFQGDPRSSQSALIKDGIEIKDAAAIAGMRRACAMASYIRAYAGACVRVGRTTDEIDALVHAECIRQGVYPSPLGYASFPKSLCSSVNQAVVHGIPDARPLESGDIVNLDVSVYVDGFHGDCSAMFVAGKADPLAEKLLTTTRECLDGAIALCKPGVPFRAIGAFIEPLANSRGFSVVRQFCGHGIGRTFHMPPLVFHCANSASEVMQAGMTFTIEPLLNEGGAAIEMMEDGWTYRTVDGSRSAQYEETILITETGAEILTKHDMPLPHNIP